MKFFQLLINISLFFSWSLVTINPVRSQSGNMSDVTLPNSGEMISDDNNTNNDTETADTADTSDTTDTADTETADTADTFDTTDTTDTETSDTTDTADTETADTTDTADTETADTADTSDTADTTDTETADTADTSDTADTTDTETADMTDTADTETADTADTSDTADTADTETADTADTTDMTNTEAQESIEPETTVEASFENLGSQSNTDIETSPAIINETVLKALSEGGNESIAVESTATTEATDTNTTEANTAIETTDTGTSNIGDTTDTDTVVDTVNTDNTDMNEESVFVESAADINEANTQESLDVTETETEIESETVNPPETDVETDPSTVEAESNGESATDTQNRIETETETSDRPETNLESSDRAESTETEVEAQEEPVTEESTEAETETQEESSEETTEEAREENQQSDFESEVDRLAYEVQVQQSDIDVAIQLQEEFQVTQLIDSSGLQIYGKPPSTTEISQRLGQLWLQTGNKPAFINISLQSNQLESFVVLPTVEESALENSSAIASTKISAVTPNNTQAATIRKTLKNTSRSSLLATAEQFRQEVSNIENLRQTTYIESAKELYQQLIEPIEGELKANEIDVLVFSMDSGLRLLPIAALHDGQQFLIEKYAVALVPSFGLTDTRYVNLNRSSILAMGASEFTEQAALPTIPVELATIVSDPRQGEIFLNEEFTIANFKAQNVGQQPFPIIHLGTHAEFQAGSLENSYIQFYDDKLNLSELRTISDELGWNSSNTTPVELLVLSACQTALGDEEAELGFAGLAVQAGVKSALASLWYISDLGTLALMSEFYDRLGNTLTKAEALRQTQLAMLEGKVLVDNGQIELTNGDSVALPPEFPRGSLELSHPYFWSAFTLIGNWN
ncbi:CHAT domain-containing protein [Myxosarcina sp. GI1(2024)]